jgi:biopolymer transport protein ExbD
VIYDSYMRTRLNSFLFTAAVILGSVSVPLTAAYAQSTPVVSITRDGGLYLNEKPVKIGVLVSEIRRNFPTASEIYFRADKHLSFDAVTHVLSVLRAAKPPISVELLDQKKPAPLLLPRDSK